MYRNSGMLPPKPELGLAKDLDKCYGCGPNNPFGLKLKFTWDGSAARAEFVPGEYHQGWPGLVHGGIIAALLDEAMGYVTWFKGLECVTAKFEVRIRCTVPVGSHLVITGSLVNESRRLVTVRAIAAQSDGRVVAEGTGTMYVVNHTRRS
ncbi:MAG: PaaI family thioesterase [Dehalococcoidia bacterium]|nr:PaaI family thioesterase [Dehalococcoidia bacterium]